MPLARFTVCFFSVGTIVLGTQLACAQKYPTKPMRIVTAEAGGGNDFGARLIAQALTVSLGQPTIVDNRPSGVIPGSVVAKAQPDGYTLLYYGKAFWIGPLLQDAPYDPIKDFAPVTMVASAPTILVVHPSVVVNSAKELIALAKAKPGQLNYASDSTGSPNHLAAELFKAMAGVDIVRIPYKGSAAALNDVIGGRVPMTFGTAAAVTPHVKSGRLKALAITSAQPSTLYPGLPTLAASLPGYEAGSIYGVFAPAKTPAAIISLLNQEIVRYLKTPEAKEKFFNTGVETIGSSPEEFGAVVKSDMLRMGKVIKSSNMRQD